MFQWMFLITALSTFAHASTTSIVEPLTAWSKKSVSVCWGNSSQTTQTDNDKVLDVLLLQSIPFEEDLKSKIKKLITKEFSIEKTGIEFTGWNVCDEFAKDDVIIFSNDNRLVLERKHFFPDVYNPYTGMASMGENGTVKSFKSETICAKNESHAKSYVYLRATATPDKMVDVDTSTMITALHEFGHLAGLRHEHARVEAQNDPNCKLSSLEPDEKLGYSYKFFGEYDPNSIMNYCYMRSLKDVVGLKFASDTSFNLKDESLYTVMPERDGSKSTVIRIGLSTGDLHSIRCLYKSDTEKNCGEE